MFALQGSFATWAGTVLDLDRPMVLIAPPGHEEEAAMRLGRIGFDHVAGYLAGGIQALAVRPDLVRCIERVTPAELATRLASPLPPIVLDVRTPTERQDTYIAGSLHMPLNRLKQQLHDVPSDRQIVLHCASGYRSSIAASILTHHGRAEVADLAGGIAAWETTGLDVVAATVV